MKSFLKHGNHIGIFLALIYIIAFAWYWVHPVQQQLNMQSFELSFFGFTGINGASFFKGLIQTYIWGYILVALWNLSTYITNCCKK